MSPVKDNIYKYTFTAKPTGVIFTSGSWGDTTQSNNVEGDNLIDGHLYKRAAGSDRSVSDLGVYSEDGGSEGGDTPSGIYYVLDGDAFNGWNQNNVKMTESTPGVWAVTATIKNGAFGIREMEGNGTFYKAVNGGTEKIESNLIGTPISVGTDGNNLTSAISGEYTFEFNKTAMTFTVKGDVSYPDLYVRSTSDGSNYLMTETNGVYTVTIDELSGTFKISDADWTADNMFGSATITDNFNGILTGKDNMSIADGKTLLNATFTFDYTTKNLKVTGTYKADQPDEPTAEYYVYFENANNWAQPYIWAYVDASNTCTTATEWPGDKMTKLDNGLWYWELPQGKPVPAKVVFNPGGDNGKTGDLTFVNKATYKPDGTFTDPSVPASADIYFNAGADFYNPERMNEGKFEGLYASLIKNDGTYTARMKMERLTGENVQLPIFVLKNVTNLSDYKGICFECKRDASNGEYYHSYKEGATSYDAAHWWKFIYATGSARGNNLSGAYAEQTYLTFEEYEAIRNAPKETVYFLGDGFNTFNKKADGTFDTESPLEIGKWDTQNMASASVSEEVYLFPVTFKDGASDIKFKMSWINPANFKEAAGAADDQGSDNRWWNTFNLGIVGPTLAPKYNGDMQQALNDGAAKEFEDDGNYSVSYIINRARTYSRYNQYNWWISDQHLTTPKETVRYVVIDTKYQTSAVVPFRPAPGLSDVKSSVAKMYDQDLDTDNATIIGNQLKGAEIAGLPQVVKINQSTGTATIQVSKGISLYQYDYEVTYFLYHGDDVIAEIQGVPNADKYEVSLANMAAGKGEELKVRCLYYDTINKTHFRSRTEAEEIVDSRSFAAPVQGDYKTTFFRDGAGWHAQVDADFTIDARNGDTFDYTLATYPDFEFVEHGLATSVRLATSEDDHVKWGIAAAHHTKWTEGEYVPETHNWSTIALGTEKNGKFENGHIKFVFENIAGPEVEVLPESRYEFKVNMIAAYPFLINNNANDIIVTIKDADGNELDETGEVRSNAPRKAADRANSYTVAMNNMPTTFKFASNVNDNLSGINDVEMGEEGESVLYNLQGIRVEGDATPGIYLRRTGSKTQKVVIR